MSSKMSFDASKVEPNKPFEPLPKAWYPVQMVDSDVIPTKAEGGKQFRFELEVISGEYKGRKIFDGYNTANKNPVAEKIGQGQLAALCAAVNVMTFKDTKELHNIPFEVELSIKPADANYDAQNRVRDVRPLEGAAKATAGAKPGWAGKKPGETAAPAAKTPPAAPGKATPPPPKKAAPAPAKVEPVTDDREFYVLVEDKPTEATGTDIIAMLADGMPEDTPVVLVGEDDWKTAADYQIGTQVAEESPAAAEEVAKPAGARPPWAKKK